MKQTAEQAAFNLFVRDGQGHGALAARAGTGKTTTILQAVDALTERSPACEIGVVAFNKKIADEIGGKLKDRGHTDWRKVQASTVHSLGFGLVKYRFKGVVVDGNKCYDILDEFIEGLLSEEDISNHKKLRGTILQLVGHAKSAGVGYIDGYEFDNRSTWEGIMEHHGLDDFDNYEDLDLVIDAAKYVYRISIRKTHIVDFDDMVLFPLLHKIRVGFPKDVIFIDEAQDLSPVRQSLIKKFCKPHGRIFLVGDEKQAIYGFSGADADAMQNLISELNCTVFPLTVTWRCPKAVVELAQTLVPDIKYAETAIDGEVAHIDFPELIDATSAILCRKNAPLLSTAYYLIRRGVACKIEGREIGTGLVKLVTRWRIKSIAQLLTKLEAYQTREVAKAVAKRNEAKEQEVLDRVGTVRVIIDMCQAKGQTLIEDVKREITNMFEDDVKGVVTLCSYHKSKGREWPTVILLDHSEHCPSKGARLQWQLDQEDNLAYVAYTRSENKLYFVNEPKESQGDEDGVAV